MTAVRKDTLFKKSINKIKNKQTDRHMDTVHLVLDKPTVLYNGEGQSDTLDLLRPSKTYSKNNLTVFIYTQVWRSL